MPLYSETPFTPIFSAALTVKLPPMTTSIRGFYMADTAYYYPEDRSISESIQVGRSLAETAINHVA